MTAPPNKDAKKKSVDRQPLTIILREEGNPSPDSTVSGNGPHVNQPLQSRITHSGKMASLGYLAAGIIHEINTPMQYIRDNLSFLQQAFDDVNKLIQLYGRLDGIPLNPETDEIFTEIRKLSEKIELDYLISEIPQAISQSQEGSERVAKILRAMKTFSHPGNGSKTDVDIKQALENTLAVSVNEWKYVADIEREFDLDLPPLHCYADELNQVFLNIIINAAHAIGSLQQGKKGSIQIKTQKIDQWLEIKISDSGGGIPENIQSRVFEPFFTTKEAGQGTGQGLAIAHDVIVEKHHGHLSFESKTGRGTTFIIRLPYERRVS